VKRVAPRRDRLNPALIRRLNVARVFHALRLAGPASQSDLVRITGLDPATVSAVARELRRDGWLATARARNSGRHGRPPILLTIDPSAGLLIGARLEPDVVRLLATTLTGEPRASWQGPSGATVEDAVAALDAGVAALLAELDASRGDVKALGLGVPALMSSDGRLAYGPNLQWRDVPLLERLQARWSAPVAVDNDTSAAALAEKLFGEARDARDFVVIAGHSGIGGALYLGGRLYRGCGGYAGEIGHVRVVPGGRRCGCGDRGCLEAYLAERAVAEQLAERGRDLPSYEAVAAAALAGDPLVLTLLDELGALLGGVIADLVDVVDPELVLLAGALAHIVPWLLPAVERACAAEALGAYRGRCRVAASALAAEAVTMGGVGLAMEALLSLPAWLVDGGGTPASPVQD
jgi:predicted NBD/HSP70 family sugar kinase